MQQSILRPRLIPRLDAWWWSVIMWPFAVTRLAWVLVAAFAQGTFQPCPTYLEYAQRGGMLTRWFLLDIFAHWDAEHYLSIVTGGYTASGELTTHYSNMAFFPLYPYLVKSVGWLGVDYPSAGYILIGLLLSNLCFLAAAGLLYRMAVDHLGLSETAARRALLLLFLFPASFFFSSFYAESLFLFLSVLGFYAALERRWWLVGVAGALVALTRFQGLVVVAVLGWMYLDARGWRLRDIRADVLWFGLVPLGLAAHLYHLYRITGEIFAPFLAQQAWGRLKHGFLEGLRLNLEAPVLDVFKIDALLLVVFLGCGAYLLVRPGSRMPRAFGLYVLLMCLMPVATGSLVSVSRCLVVIFPVFFLLGEKLEHSEWFGMLCGLWFALQVIYFAGWANYYWIA